MSKTDIKKEIERLDVVVTKFNLAREICPGRSEHIPKGDNVPGEGMFYHDYMFLVKRIAMNDMGYNADDLLMWSPQEAITFYREHSLSTTYKFQTTFMEEGKKTISNWYFKGRSSTYMNFLAYRWDNDMAFLDYESRIVKSIANRNIMESEKVREQIRVIEEREAVMSSMKGELEQLKLTEGLSEQLLNLLGGIEITVLDVMENGD